MALGEPSDDRTHTELMALQELACADIAFFKNQQWQAAYYGLLLYAALAAFPQLMSKGMEKGGHIVLWLVALIVLLKGWYVLGELETALKRRRDLLPFVRRHFTNESKIAYGLGKPDDALKIADEKVSLKNVFLSVYVLGFILTTWVLAVGWANA